LLRSPNWPDSQADRGIQEFTYSLYPHSGSWEEAETVKRGYELNVPFQVLVNPDNYQSSANGCPSQSFLDLSADNLILMAFKPSEDDLEKFIIRFYECHGKTANLFWQSDFLALGEQVDLLENNITSAPINPENMNIQPWKIATFAVSVKT
jgi:alpha-mannosidase